MTPEFTASASRSFAALWFRFFFAFALRPFALVVPQLPAFFTCSVAFPFPRGLRLPPRRGARRMSDRTRSRRLCGRRGARAPHAPGDSLRTRAFAGVPPPFFHVEARDLGFAPRAARGQQFEFAFAGFAFESARL